MTEKNLKVRIVHKHDIEANWIKAINFIPRKGELIVYDPDETYNYVRYKFGDGVTNVNDLPFSTKQADWNQSDATAADYVKNRTHYPEIVVRAAETTAYYDGYGSFYGDFTSPIDVESFVGKTITFDIGDNVYQRELIRGIYRAEEDYIIYYVGDWLENLEAGTMDEFSASLTETGISFFIPEFKEESPTDSLHVIINCIESPLKQLDEKYIPDTIARKSDIAEQVQANWNQNDETSPDYVKNRTHYTTVETSEEVYYGSGTLTLSDNHYVGEVSTNIFEEYEWVSTASASFRVVINDKEYHVGSDEAFDVRGFGFMNMGDFVSMEIESSLVDTQVTSLEVTIYAYQKVETTHTLPEKYIPDTIARTSAVNSLKTEVNTVKTNVNKCVKSVNGKTPINQGNVLLGYDDLKTKPFEYYVEHDYEALDNFDGRAFQFDAQQDGCYVSFQRHSDLDMALSVYTPLNITWDGVEYNGVEIEYEFDDNYNELRSCGDSQFINYPFYIISDGYGELEPRIYTSTAGSHTIKITFSEKTEVNKISINHIPTDIARKSDIETAVNSLVDTAPDALNTLNELSKALGDNPNFATTILTEVGKKVDKVDGKGLSTNDYTNTEKNKLAGIETGAQKNVQADWNQTDENAPDYIKNRTHYCNLHRTGESQTIVFKSITREPTSDIEGKIRCDLRLSNFPDDWFSIAAGKPIGTKFILEANYKSLTIFSGLVIKYELYDFTGDGSFSTEIYGDELSVGRIDPSTGELACFYGDDGEMRVTFHIDGTNYPNYDEDVSVTIHLVEEHIKTIDEKYIPDSIARSTQYESIGQNSFAVGLNTLAGSKAFTILSINSNNKTFTLDSVEGLEVNDVYSAFLVNNTTSKQFENYGKIEAINGNVVTVDIFPTVTEIVTADSYINDAGYDSEENSFRIILKPTVGTRTIGANTFASGSGSKALSKNSVAFGVGNTAHGSHSFVAGSGNTVNYASAAFGRNNKAIYDQSMAFGGGNTASGYSSLATGQETEATGITSSSFGFNTAANGNQSMATGEETKATGQRSFTGGYKSQATNTNAVAIGENTRATGENSVSIGKETQATGNRSFATGFKTVSSGTNSVAIGNASQATGHHSMAVGSLVTSYGSCSHAEGQSTNNIDTNSLASKDNIINYWKTKKVSVAYGDRSHVEGQDNLVTGSNSHAEGQNNLVTGAASHAEGNHNEASGVISHAEGNYTIAASNNQHVQGTYNISDTENRYAHIVGNGTDNGNRSNAHTLDWDGNAWFAGEVRVGKENEKLVTETELNEKITIAIGNAIGGAY